MISRILFSTLRGLAAVAVLLLLTLLLGWSALQWFVAPRLDSYRPQLTAWMSRALDAQVDVQQLSVDSSWWRPVVVARELEINGADGQPGLRAGRARLRLSPLALLRGSSGALELQAPEIWLRRDAEGVLSVAGVARTADAEGAEWAGHLLLLEPTLALRGARLHWSDAVHGSELTLDDVNLQLRGGRRRIGANVTAGQLAGRMGPDLPSLQLSALAGRVRWQHTRFRGGNARIRLDDLSLVMDDGSRLNGAALAVDYPLGAAATAVRVHASSVGLPALGRLAQRLPWPDGLPQALRDFQVRAGMLETLDAQWRGSLRAPGAWQASGRVQDLTFASVPADVDEGAAAGSVGWPGVEGLNLAFETDEVAGHATLAMDTGSLSFPGVFEDPDIAVQRLRVDANWQVDGGGIQVHVPRLELSNADADGQFSGSWRSGDGRPDGTARFPGFMDLSGRLIRGDGARVHRYLPLVLPADARHYVRDAIVQGQLSDVAVHVRGLLDEVPFNLAGEHGVFSIAGQVNDGVMVYVPQRFQDAGEPAWPALTELHGQLAFEGAAMRVRQASAQVQGHSGWDFTEISADIADFDAEQVAVTASAAGSGELATALDIVRASPLAALTGHALDDAQASGLTELQLALDLPVSEPSHATVRGSVELQQNTVTLHADAPPLEAAQGSITFTETGFAMDDVQARALGGPVRLSGGLRGDSQGSDELAHVKLRGQASAAGLQKWLQRSEPASWSAWAATLDGEATYELELDLAMDGVRAIALDSDLQGLALVLPPPLEKPAGDRWPLHLSWQLQDAAAGAPASELALQLADRLALQWTLPPGPAAVPRGTIAWGAAARRPLPPAGPGFALIAELDALDVDPWMPFIGRLGSAVAPSSAASRWLPDRWRVKLGQLRVAGHELTDLVASGLREGTHWQGEVESPDLTGQLQYQEGGAGQAGHVVARLSRLRVQPVAEALPPDTEPTRELPSVDLRADHFFWKDLDLGQLDLRASRADSADARVWRIDQLLLTTPEARLQASGSRALASDGQNSDSGQTRLDFQLTLDDGGALLDRLGQSGLVAGGAGSVAGELSWPGSPLDFSLAETDGTLQLDVAHGRFLKMEPGAGKLLGILSLQALPRRFILDFKDVFRSGWTFDRVQARARLARGILSTRDLQIRGVGAIVAIRGQTNLQKQTLDLRLNVEPQLDAGAAALAATAVNPALGAATFIAQLALRKPLGRATARAFRVRGSWSQPEVEPMQPSAAATETGGSPVDEPENQMPAAGENSP